ncbi:hypothetical protein D3C85_874070 [compost metagenome]
MENQDRIQEAIFDISLMAGSLLAQNKIKIGDSRELKDRVIELAYQFEAMFDEIVEQKGDYIGAIDAYAESELLELYGITRS